MFEVIRQSPASTLVGSEPVIISPLAQLSSINWFGGQQIGPVSIAFAEATRDQCEHRSVGEDI